MHQLSQSYPPELPSQTSRGLRIAASGPEGLSKIKILIFKLKELDLDGICPEKKKV